MINYRLLGMRLGEKLKYDRSIGEIERFATSIFDFEIKSYHNKYITSSRAQKIYDCILSLSEQRMDEKEKLRYLDQFMRVLCDGTDLDPEKLLRESMLVEIKEFGDCSAFWNLIHEEIVRVSKNKFEDGYFADAVESAFKEINKRIKTIVKNETGNELDGVALMRKAFNPRDPIIVIDNLSTQSGKDIQEGYMQLYAGSMQGIRNPKAHDNISISRERAIHFLFLASLLINVLYESRKNRHKDY